MIYSLQHGGGPEPTTTTEDLMNPHKMSVHEIAAQASRAQLVDAIGRATQGLMSGTQTAGWSALLDKLNTALRLQLTPNRPILAHQQPSYAARHASTGAELVSIDTNGLAHFAGVRY
jgi:hypothetical protein